MATATLDLATEYAGRGWAVIPIPHRSKVPILKGWQNLRLSPDTIARHFNGEPQNIGVLLGEASGGLVDVDLDHPEALALARDYLPSTGAWFGRPGNPESHWLYRVENPPATRKYATTLGTTLLELRSTGGQTVLPGSMHPSGELVEWYGHGEPAEIGLDELLAACKSLAGDVAHAIGEELPARPTPAPQPVKAGQVDGDSATRRAMAYLKKLPPAIAGQGGHHATFRAACECVRFGLEGAKLREALQWFNANRCDPPWSDRELEHKAVEAERANEGRVGVRLDERLAPAAAARQAIREAAVDEGQPEPPATSRSLKFYTAAEFDELDLRRDYHIPGVLAAGPVPTVAAGSFKTLKTSITMDLMFSLATGTRFLNHFSTTAPTPVAVMSGESGGHALQALMRRIARNRGYLINSIGDNFHICPDVLSLSDQGELDHVERFIVEHGIRLFAIDPTYLALRGLRSDDAGSIFAMGRYLEPLARMGERTGCTPIIVHHNSRGATRANPGEPAELADIAWSGFAEWAGQWLLLARRERYNPDSDGEHRLWLTAGGRDGHSTLVGVDVTEGRADDPGGRRWDVHVEQASRARREAAEAEHDRRERDREARRQKQIEKDRDAVLAAMKAMPDGETKTGSRDRTALRNDRFNPAFAELLTEGIIVACQIAKGNNRTYDGYTLQPDAPGRTGTHNGQNSRLGAVASETDAPL